MSHPVSFSIPSHKFVCAIPTKSKLLSSLIPGDLNTYIYSTETEYYAEYQRSAFALTKIKGGWDCLRHYEIVANGAIPYFVNFEAMPPKTMANWPRELQSAANKLYERLHIKYPSNIFAELSTEEHAECTTLAKEFLEYGRLHLNSKTAARYVLEQSGHASAKKILYLSGISLPEYLHSLTLLGFKELLGNATHDFPKAAYLYTDDPTPLHMYYGKGMTYGHILNPELHDTTLDMTLLQDIQDHYYDVVIYGCLHWGLPFLEQVRNSYMDSEIIFMCGDDLGTCAMSPGGVRHPNFGHMFMREII